jgi:speckle-type POZ protein
VFSNLMIKHGVGRILETNDLQLFNFFVDKASCQSCPEKCNSEPPYFHLRLDFLGSISLENETVLGYLSNAFDRQSAADVLFIVRGEKIKAHSLLVNLASAKLASMLQDSIKVQRAEDATTEKSENGCCKEIVVDDVEPETFRQMLRYVYTGLVPVLETEAEALLVAAHKYEIEDLKDLSEQTMISKVDLDCAIRYLISGHENAAPALMKASTDCLIDHKAELCDRQEWKDLENNNPEVFNLVSSKLVV